MPRAEFLEQLRIHREGQKTCRRRNPVALNDYRPIMKRTTGFKNRTKQIARNKRFKSNSAFNKRSQADVPLDHY